MTSKIGITLIVIPLSWVTAACKYSEPKEPETGGTTTSHESTKPDESSAPAEKAESTEEPGGAATSASGACDDRACTASEECCKGYACGFDPERSKVQRFCLAQ